MPLLQLAGPIQSPNHLEKDFGQLTPEQKLTVTEIMRIFMEGLRGILKEATPVFYDQNPNERRPCETCAFNPSTDSFSGFTATAYGMMKSIRDVKPFFCHDNQPNWRDNVVDHPQELKMCRGFLALISIHYVSARMIADSIFKSLEEAGLRPKR